MESCKFVSASTVEPGGAARFLFQIMDLFDPITRSWSESNESIYTQCIATGKYRLVYAALTETESREEVEKQELKDANGS
jgi:hypothetical protein